MDHLQLVRMLQPMADLHQQGNSLRQGEWAATSLVFAERLSLEIRHDQIEHPIRGLPQPENGADVRMTEAGRDRRLAAEPLYGRRVPRQPGQQDLHRHRAAGVDLGRAVDVRHPALAEAPLHLIAVVEHLSRQGAVVVELLGGERRGER